MTEEGFETSIRLMVNGDKEGLERIYEEYLPYIYSIIITLVQRKEDAEDITSEFFLRLWNNAEKHKPGSGHRAYLGTIARNMAIDHLRKRKREVLGDMMENPDKDDGEKVLNYEIEKTRLKDNGDAGGFEEKLVNEITIKEALKTLKPEESEIINLKIMGELTFNEISQILGVPIGTVTWRYREAINKLRKFGYDG